ncbi:MAG: hypothetical protein HGN29_15290 [Asgard group archaeon]|nr:hypothetical protein [Asgard group archaeon]
MEYTKLRKQRIRFLIILSMIILGQFLASSLGTSFMSTDTKSNDKTYDLQGNIVYFNSTEPVIDGILDSYIGEWENATVYNSEFGKNHIPITIRVQANLTHLFMGLSYTSSIYIPINTTIPVGDSYNNESHTWYTILFDRNYDRSIGSELSPDDAIAINYRIEGAQDSYVNGTNDVNSFVTDLDIGGEENSFSALTEEEGDFNEHIVSIELVKELKSEDIQGYDIELNPSDSMNFGLIVFQNYTASFNYTYLFENRPTILMTFTLEPQHTFFSHIEDYSKMDVLTYATQSDKTAWENMTSFSYFLSSYDMNVTHITPNDNYVFTAKRLADLDLVILAGSLRNFEDDEIEALRSYAASGGSLMILGDAGRRGQRVNELLAYFGVEIYNATLFSKELTVNSSISVDNSALYNLPYLSNTTAFTDQAIDLIEYDGSAINFTLKTGEGIIQLQDGDLYPTIEILGDYFIDLDKDGMFDASNDKSINDSATLQAGVELLRGGRLIITASSDFMNNSYVASASNRYMFLRQVQWLLGFQNTISFDTYNILQNEVVIDEAIDVEISVTGDNGTILDNLRVYVAVQELKTDINKANLTTVDDTNYNGSIIPQTTRDKAKFIDIVIRMHQRGHGYNETSLYQIYVKPINENPLEPDIIALILFIVSIGLVGVGAFAIKKYKIIEKDT